MSIVAVHGPNTWATAGAAPGGGGGPEIVEANGTFKVTADQTDGLKFTVTPLLTGRPAADYDWVLAGAATPGTALADTKTPFVVTYAAAGTKTIQLVVAAGAGPPPGGTYNVVVAAVSGPRSAEEGEGGAQQMSAEEPPTNGNGAYYPSDHTVDEVKAEADANADDTAYIQSLLDAERAGKNRTTLVSYLEGLLTT